MDESGCVTDEDCDIGGRGSQQPRETHNGASESALLHDKQPEGTSKSLQLAAYYGVLHSLWQLHGAPTEADHYRARYAGRRRPTSLLAGTCPAASLHWQPPQHLSMAPQAVVR